VQQNFAGEKGLLWGFLSGSKYFMDTEIFNFMKKENTFSGWLSLFKPDTPGSYQPNYNIREKIYTCK
jgi:hypothetical protein